MSVDIYHMLEYDLFKEFGSCVQAMVMIFCSAVSGGSVVRGSGVGVAEPPQAVNSIIVTTIIARVIFNVRISLLLSLFMFRK
jgi:hypothetical protein